MGIAICGGIFRIEKKSAPHLIKDDVVKFSTTTSSVLGIVTEEFSKQTLIHKKDELPESVRVTYFLVNVQLQDQSKLENQEIKHEFWLPNRKIVRQRPL